MNQTNKIDYNRSKIPMCIFRKQYLQKYVDRILIKLINTSLIQSLTDNTLYQVPIGNHKKN